MLVRNFNVSIHYIQIGTVLIQGGTDGRTILLRGRGRGDGDPHAAQDPTTQQLVKYAGASGDYYQIHYDLGYAKNNGLPDVILTAR